MKPVIPLKIALCAVMLALAPVLKGLDSDPELATGRASLENQDIPAALAAFQDAVTSSGSEKARVMLAVTRLAHLYNEPQTVELLNRWGFSQEGRDPYDWTSESPVTEDSLPEAANLQELRIFVAETMLPQISASIADLDAVISAEFSMYLRPEYLGLPASEHYVIVDFTDVRLVRSGLGAFSAALRLMITSNNLDLPLAQLWGPDAPEDLSLEQFLEYFPNLGHIQSGSQRTAAQADLEAAIAAYLAVAENLHLSSRVDAAFVLEPDEYEEELEFREVLLELVDAFNGPVELGSEPIVVDVRPFFLGFDLRAHMPPLRGDGILLRQLPDPTLAGILPGMTLDAWAEFLIKEGLDVYYHTRWDFSSWFGLFDVSRYPLFYHREHGWLVSHDDFIGPTTYFDTRIGSWFRTDSSIFPWLYKYGVNQGWYYYQVGGSPGNRMFYRGINSEMLAEQALNNP